jgi:hypothetical protein
MEMKQRLEKMGVLVFVSVFFFTNMGWTNMCWAALQPEKVYPANSKKLEAYVRDGLIVGGDRAINEVTIRDIRRAINKGFERLVIDLEGTRNGESVAIQRPPFYQVAVNLEEKRLIFTLWGNPRFGFDARKITKTLKKSPLIDSVELFPKLEEDHWIFAINLKTARSAEVFELTNPARIIIDIKSFQ